MLRGYIFNNDDILRLDTHCFCEKSKLLKSTVFYRMAICRINTIIIKVALFAFRHINGKSVDFVLCDKETLRPAYAIELDDLTHEQSDRRKRDAEVERIFKEANLPSVRFKNKNLSETEIIQALSGARKLSELNGH